MSLWAAVADSLLIEIFSTWIDEKSLARIDSAICNSQNRRIFLGILYDHGFRFECETLRPEPFQDSIKLAWFCLRRIKPLKLSVHFITDRIASGKVFPPIP